MIRYSLDSNIRIVVACTLLATSLVLAWLLDDFLNSNIAMWFQQLGKFGPDAQKLFPYSVSFLTFWAISWKLFDLFVWRLPVVNWLVAIPDVSGHWTGLMHRTDYTTGKIEENIPVAMSVKQTFSHISIRFWSTREKQGKAGTPSDATLAGMVIRSSNAVSVYYMFQFFSGKGLCEMTFLKDKKGAMTAQYVSTVPRVGSFTLSKANS